MFSAPAKGLLPSLAACLAAGAGVLSGETRAALCTALADDWQPDGLAAGRARQGDLYYTLFAVLLSRALAVPVPADALRRQLDRLRRAPLDRVHAAARDCLQAVVTGPRPGTAWRTAVSAARTACTALHDPYAVFLAAVGAEACRLPLPWFLLAWWAPWRWQTVPQAAAVLTAQTLAQSALRRPEQARRWILEQSLPAGGFRVGPAAPAADLLSTGVALFSLACSGWDFEDEEADRHAAFIQACWSGTGHWTDLPGGSSGDCEYSFYALLGLGAVLV